MRDDVDDDAELMELVRGFRVHLEWQQRAGVYGALATPTARPPVLAPDAEEMPAARPDKRAGKRVAESPETVSESTGQDNRTVNPVDGESVAVEVAESPAASGRRPSLTAIRDDLGDCHRCKLAPTRTNIVFGVGDPETALMFIGEAPGAHEDRRGEPFVGPAGQLLDRMIEAMGWTRDTVYIANIIKCRPPNNRDPQPDEIDACQPFLIQQIKSVRPRVIVTLGRPASQVILQSTAPMNALRGRFREFMGIRVMPTFHPAYLLRSPNRKRETWSDLKQVIGELSRLGIQPPRIPKT